MNEFSRLVRSHSKDVVRAGMATCDFATMYTAFDQTVICQNVIAAFKEA